MALDCDDWIRPDGLTLVRDSATGLLKAQGGSLPAPISAALFAAMAPTAVNPVVTNAGWDLLRARLFRTPEDFGAVGNDAHDDTPHLQAGIDSCAASGLPFVGTSGKIYRTTDMLQIGSGSEICSLLMLGPQVGPTPGRGTACIHATATNKPALNIQGARYVEVSGWLFLGDNAAAAVLAHPAPAVSAYVTPGLSSSRWSPHAGIAIDALAGPMPAGGYPGKTYGQYTSANVLIRNCIVQNFVCGVLNFATGSLGDSIRCEHVQTTGCAYPFCVTETQSRQNTYVNCNANGFHTCVDGRTFGARNGSAPAIDHMEIGVGFRALNVNTTFDVLRVRKLYAEAICSLGTVQGALPASFTDCNLNMFSTPYRALVHGFLGSGTTRFDTCLIGTQQPFLNFVHNGQGYTTYENCGFQSNSEPFNPDYQVNSRVQRGYNRVRVRDSNVSCADNTGVATLNESPELTFPGKRIALSQCTRWVRTYGTANQYLYDGDMNVRPGFPDHAVGVAADGYSWVNDLVTFMAGTVGEFAIGDMLYWRVLATGSGGAPDAGDGVLEIVNGNIVALKVENIVGGMIAARVQGEFAELDRADSPALLYIALRDWAPSSALTGTWLNATAALMMSDPAFPLQVGDFVRAAVGLPAICRVTAVTGAAVMLSKPTTSARTAEPLFCSQLKGF